MYITNKRLIARIQREYKNKENIGRKKEKYIENKKKDLNSHY